MRERGRSFVGALVAAVTLVAGVLLRAGAHGLAWPKTYVYLGERSATPWAIRERALTDVSYALMLLGVLMLAVAFHHWLGRAPRSGGGPGRG